MFRLCTHRATFQPKKCTVHWHQTLRYSDASNGTPRRRRKKTAYGILLDAPSEISRYQLHHLFWITVRIPYISMCISMYKRAWKLTNVPGEIYWHSEGGRETRAHFSNECSPPCATLFRLDCGFFLLSFSYIEIARARYPAKAARPFCHKCTTLVYICECIDMYCAKRPYHFSFFIGYIRGSACCVLDWLRDDSTPLIFSLPISRASPSLPLASKIIVLAVLCVWDCFPWLSSQCLVISLL